MKWVMTQNGLRGTPRPSRPQLRRDTPRSGEVCQVGAAVRQSVTIGRRRDTHPLRLARVLPATRLAPPPFAEEVPRAPRSAQPRGRS